MNYNVAITGNFEIKEEDFELLTLLVFVQTTNLIKPTMDEDAGLVYHLSTQSHFKAFNEHFINMLNSNGIRWRYFKHSFFNSANLRNKEPHSVFIIASDLTSMEDMLLVDMIKLHRTKNFSVDIETIILNESLTTATPYVNIVDRYKFDKVVVLNTNERKTLF